MYSCSLFIVNWNSWVCLERCLEALKIQTYQGFNVFVADNGSDQVPPIELLSLIPNLEFIQNETNLGFAEANNQLLAYAKASEWLVLLNPDAYPEPDWLEQLLKAANQNPNYSFFASRQVMAASPNKLDGQGDVYHMSGLAWRDGYSKPVPKQQEVKEVFSPCAAAAMYRTEKFLAVGGFDRDYFCYFEDVDLGFRLRLMGERCLLVPTAIVHHQGSASTGGQHSDFSVYYGHRNMVWTYVKNMPGLLFYLFLPYHLALNIISIILFSIKGQGGVIIRAKRDALKALPSVWKQRAKIQKTRQATVFNIFRALNKALIPKLFDYLRSK